jgi:hypothetical protein
VIGDSCSKQTNYKRIVFEERGRKATFNNENQNVFVKTQVDGCLMVQQLSADWVLSKPNVGHVIIELKGKDVDHAVKQINATANHLKTHCRELCKKKCKKCWIDTQFFAGLVVANQYPRITTSIQRMKDHFAKVYKAPLHVVNMNADYQFECVLSFKGPFKL